MKTDIIYISEKLHLENTIQSKISFKKFIDFLKESVETGSPLKVPYFKWILKKFEKLPELAGIIPLERVKDYEEILELISTCLLPLASNEKTLWALSNSLSAEIFYSTSGLYDLIRGLKMPKALNPNLSITAESEKINQELLYGLVLEKIYNLPYLKKRQWVRKFEDPVTGLDKYYQVHIDTRFVDIRPIDKLPDFECSAMLPSSVIGEEFKKIQKQLPLNRFEAVGFSFLTFNEVTAHQAVEQIGKLIINSTEENKFSLFEEIIHSLQTVVGSRDYQFGVVPFLTINDRPALLYENFPFSIIVQACWQSEVSKKEFTALRLEFTNNPKVLAWSAEDKNNQMPDVIVNAFMKAGISSYMMFPVYHDKQLTGMFEISTRDGYPMMNEGQLVKLRPVLPLISQLIQNLLAKFNNNIEQIIKEKFTSIQPSVQWKFNETAWHYLRDHIVEDKVDTVENIIFRDLHPLYGAVDIRNSTVLRNQALAKDFTLQLNVLIETILTLDIPVHPELNLLLGSARSWKEMIPVSLTTQQEIRLNDFFNLDVQYELENLMVVSPETKPVLDNYFRTVDESTGAAFENRRQLEISIQQVNIAVNNFYEDASAELQEIYPCYFEKFRTDGVEYDIYVGQSIQPKKPFLKKYLQQMKRWQLQSMIKVVRLTEELITQMPNPLQTTQLLFVHPQLIDITFRKDERRFDVEGAYNIRYHIIKKRIDKVFILDSAERLTQPGKIALVYFEERDANEYKIYIRELQEKNLLLNDLEELELESLQGVDGLKALRVGVVI